MTDMLISH